MSRIDSVSLLAFAGVFVLVCLAGRAWYRAPSQVWSRFRKRWGLDSQHGPPKSGQPELAVLTEDRPFMAIVEPKTDLDRRHIKLQLAQAGFNQALAVAYYVAARLALAGLGFLAAAGGHLGLWGWSLRGPLWGLAGGLAGYLLPEIALRWRQRKRQEHLRKTLPEALDLLAISVECGQGVDAALREVAREIRESSAALADELDQYFHQLDVGCDRQIALQDLALRSGLPEIRAVTALLIQSHRLGSAVAQSLQDHSRGMRAQRRQRAEERARKAAVTLIFPLVLFIFPGIFVALVGPAAIMIMRDVFALR